MDTIKPVERNWKLGLLADAIQGVYDFGSKPFGYDNPPVKGLLDLATVPSIAKTIDRLSWGDNLTTGKGQTTRILPETADALLAAVPAMNVAERLTTKGANYVARNAGPYLDRTVGGFIEGQIAKNGAPSRYLQDMARGTQSPLTVWHGSPHKFDKFDSSKIGTGEGAQAYGHGLYLAENPKVASEYIDPNNAPQWIVNGKELTDNYGPTAYAAKLLATNGSPPVVAINNQKSLLSRIGKLTPEKEQYFADTIKEIQRLESTGAKIEKGGSLYKVDLPDEHIAKMLDWDKPLNRQSDAVKEALNPLIPKIRAAAKDDEGLGGYLGKGIYELLGDGKASPQTAQMLREAGIPGIRYLDGGSRGAGAGSSNFVVFPGNEDILKILERNGQGLLAP